MELTHRAVIAIDGYSSCGKSSFAKAIAARLNYLFIDSGAMYRAITLMALRGGAIADGSIDTERVIEIANQEEITFNAETGGVMVNGEVLGDAIRTMEVNTYVSEVSAIEQVRSRLVAQQQLIGKSGGVVMDGRDIGTVVFPDAEIKIFMTATPEIRAERRFLELKAKGIEANLEEVIANVVSRDRADENRAVSPLRKADDAILLDNSHMSIEGQMEWFLSIISRC